MFVVCRWLQLRIDTVVSFFKILGPVHVESCGVVELTLIGDDVEGTAARGGVAGDTALSGTLCGRHLQGVVQEAAPSGYSEAAGGLVAGRRGLPFTHDILGRITILGAKCEIGA